MLNDLAISMVLALDEHKMNAILDMMENPETSDFWLDWDETNNFILLYSYLVVTTSEYIRQATEPLDITITKQLNHKLAKLGSILVWKKEGISPQTMAHCLKDGYIPLPKASFDIKGEPNEIFLRPIKRVIDNTEYNIKPYISGESDDHSLDWMEEQDSQPAHGPIAIRI